MNGTFVSFVLLLIAALPNALSAQTSTPSALACPADAFVCADGTVVERSGADCSFRCPVSSEPILSTTSPTQVPPSNLNRPLSLEKPLSPERQQRVINLAANMSNRLDAVVARFSLIAERLDLRLTKIESTGVAMTAARNQLQTVETRLAELTTLLADIDIRVVQATTSATPYRDWLLLSERYNELARKTRQLQQDLRTVILLAQNPPVVAQPAQ